MANNVGDGVKGLFESYALASVLCAVSGKAAVAFPNIYSCLLRFHP